MNGKCYLDSIKNVQRSRIPEKDTCVYSTSYTARNFEL